MLTFDVSTRLLTITRFSRPGCWFEAIQQAGGHNKFFLHVQCANQFLVITCLYPDFINRLAKRRGAPDVDYYDHVIVSHQPSCPRG